MRLFTNPVHALPLIFGLLIVVALLHLGFGAKPVALSTILQAFHSFDLQNFDHVIIRQMRVPRMIAAICVGAALSVAGALMQGVTRNPLADPGLLALMSGAAFGVVVGSSFLGIEADIWMPALAAAGALAAACLVTIIALFAPSGRSPAVLLLSGAAVSAFLNAMTSGINLLNEESFSTFRVWLSGAITTDALHMLPYAAPWLIGGLLLALGSARQVTALSMGHEAATGLGVNATSLSIRLLLCTVVLTASAVAMVGPLGFVGLVVPHATRLLVGSDYRWIIPCSALVGALFLLMVDLAARMVLAPVEIATGVVTTFLGAPLFVLLVRRVL
ncbi:MAG: iron ABC transporter permease [Cohaesibacter sp.]|nr:iron ABC transporter permease [Cohaesibacter sp.]